MSEQLPRANPGDGGGDRKNTRLRLIYAAEALAASGGIGGLSAREIAKRANLRNNVSVQYHFGSIDGLLKSLVQQRMQQLDEIRGEMIQKNNELSIEPSVSSLVELILIPHLILARRENGQATYAAFLCQYLPAAYPLGFDWVMRSSDPDLPALNIIFADLARLLPHLPTEIFHRRVTSSSLLFLNVLQGLPATILSDERVLEISPAIRDALVQSTAVMLAPFPA